MAVTIQELKQDIVKSKKILRAYWKRYGAHENFGEEELRRIRDLYFSLSWDYVAGDYHSIMNDFMDWCHNYTGVD